MSLDWADVAIIAFLTVLTILQKPWIGVIKEKGVREDKKVEVMLVMTSKLAEQEKAFVDYIANQGTFFKGMNESLCSMKSSIDAQTQVLRELRFDVRNAVSYARANGVSEMVDKFLGEKHEHESREMADTESC